MFSILGALKKYQRTQWQQVIRVAQVVIHPQYNDNTLDYDLALVQIRRPAKLSRFVHTICLPNEQIDFATGTMCHVTGWGYNNQFNSVPKVFIICVTKDL